VLTLLITLYEIIQMIRISFLFCLSASLIACNSGIDQKMSEQQAAPTLQNTAQPATQGTLQPATTTAAPAPTAGAVNPPHGQPGHNCDIAVGAPLTASPAANQPANAAPANQLLTQPQVTIAAPQGASPAPSSNVRLNPAHGQPGHNCAVEVGKPL
jgi:hypothetical protein